MPLYVIVIVVAVMVVAGGGDGCDRLLPLLVWLVVARLWLSSLVTWYCCHTGAPLQVGSEGLCRSTVDDVDVTGING